MRGKPTTEPTDLAHGIVFHVPARPPQLPPVDEALWLQAAEQRALRDAGSGEMDVFAVLTIDGLFPYEVFIDGKIQSAQHEAAQRRFDNPVLGAQFVNAAAHFPGSQRCP